MVKNWHLQLFKKSILKQAKLKAIAKYLPLCSGKTCMDLGGDNGILSYYLRKKGGTWHSLDLSGGAIESIKKLVGNNVYKIDNEHLPFNNNSFDTIVIIDFLEHIHKDKDLIKELARVSKNNAALIVNVPHIKKFSTIRLIRNIIGLTDTRHGHLRPGYTKEGLRKILEPYFYIKSQRTYSRFFTELVDIIINFPQLKKESSSKGVLVAEKDFRKNLLLFRIYSLIYPLFWILSKLDLLLLFTKGHSLIVLAEKA